MNFANGAIIRFCRVERIRKEKEQFLENVKIQSVERGIIRALAGTPGVGLVADTVLVDLRMALSWRTLWVGAQDLSFILLTAIFPS